MRYIAVGGFEILEVLVGKVGENKNVSNRLEPKTVSGIETSGFLFVHKQSPVIYYVYMVQLITMSKRKDLKTMAYGLKMIEALHNEDLEGAHALLDQAIENDSDEEHFDLAEQLLQLGFLDEAEALYGTLLINYPGEGELLVALAEISVDRDDEDTALAYLEQVHPEDENYPRALLVLADLYQSQGLFEVTEQKLQEAKDMLPEEPIIDFALAEHYNQMGRFSNAINHYNAVSEAGIDEISGVLMHQRLAECYSSGGAFEEAIRHYEEALEQRANTDTLFGLAFTAYQAHKMVRAIEAFNQLKELDPNYTSLYPYLAKAYEHENRLVEAFTVIKEGTVLDNFNKELYYEGGKLALKLDDEKAAEKYLRETLVLDPHFMEAALTLNKLFLKQEDYPAVIDLSGWMEQENEEIDPQLDWDMALAHKELEEYDKAGKAFEKALTRYQDNPLFLKDYGYFMREEGNVKRALELWNKYLGYEPEDDEIIQEVSYLNERE